MFEELERQSLLEKKDIQHPYIPFVYICNKEYFCRMHQELLPLNRGAMRQHVQGKKHRLNFDTGKPIVRTKNLHVDVDEQAKEWVNQKSSKKEATESDPFRQLYIRLRIIFQQNDPVFAYLLAKYGLEGKLSDDVIKCIKWNTDHRIREARKKPKSVFIRPNLTPI